MTSLLGQMGSGGVELPLWSRSVAETRWWVLTMVLRAFMCIFHLKPSHSASQGKSCRSDVLVCCP